MIEPTVITGPITEAVSIDELKEHLKLDTSVAPEDIARLAMYEKTARQYWEWRTGRTIHQTTYEFTLDSWPSGDAITLPRATPLITIDWVKYKDSDALVTTWSAAEYIADTDSTPGRLVLGYNQSWPSFTAYPVSPIRIRYTAGLASSPAVDAPEDIKFPIALLASAFWENREAFVMQVGLVQRVSIDYGVEHFIARRALEHVF